MGSWLLVLVSFERRKRRTASAALALAPGGQASCTPAQAILSESRVSSVPKTEANSNVPKCARALLREKRQGVLRLRLCAATIATGAHVIPSSGSDPASESKLIDLDEDHAKAVAFNMLFMVWRRRTLPAAYQGGIALLNDLAKRFPEGVGVLNVVEVDAIPPDAQAREVFAQLLHLPQLRHFSVTHEGSGFKAASVRAIVAGTVAFVRPRCAYGVHRSVSDAARWHAREQGALNHREPPDRIVQIAQALRGLHRNQYP